MPTVPMALLQERCLNCPLVVSALSMQAVFEGMKDHAEYINRTADPNTDPHFEELRLDRLIAH